MRSILTDWFLNLKLQVSIEEAKRQRNCILDLRNHGLEECPNFLVQLPEEYRSALKCLLLQSNVLPEFLRVNCHTLQSLKGLTLDYNRLVDIPFDFRRLKNLTVLNVSHNKFESLHFFYVICQLKSLRVLWANATGLRDIPIEISELSRLRILGLRRNHITTLPKALFSLTTLRWLTLADNKISEIPSEISNLENVVHLNLQRNFLVDLPDAFFELQEIRYLFLDYNQLLVDSNLKERLSQLPSLKYCSVSRNSGSSASSDIQDEDIIINGNESPTNAGSMSPDDHTLSSQNEENENRNTVEATNPCTDPLLSFTEFIRQEHSCGTQENSSGSGSENLERGNARSDEETTTTLHDSFDPLFYNFEDEFFNEENEEPNNNGQGDINMHPMEVVFTWDAVDAEAQALEDGQLPFNNNELAVTSGGASAEIFPEDTNGNINNDLTREKFSEISRTQNWIFEQLRSWVPEEGNHHIDQGVVGENCSDVTIPERTLERVENQVDFFMNDAAQVVQHVRTDNIDENRDYGAASSVPSSLSLVYLMRHGREPQPYRVSVTASFACNRSTSSTSVATTLSTLNENSINQDEVLPFLNVRDNNNLIEGESEHFFNSSRSLLQAGYSSLLSHLDANDLESNYDPSDWEHSAPSSAIDDQDIIMRFSEDFPEDTAEDDDGDGVQLLSWLEWKRIVSLVLIR